MAAEKEIKVINGTEVTFYPASHQRRVDGKQIPSVSSISGMIDKSNALLVWSERLARKYLAMFLGETLTENIIETAVMQYKTIKDEAGESGTDVHKLCELFILAVKNGTEKPVIDETISQPVINGYNAFLKWYNENDVQFIESERDVYSKEHNYVGTFDVLMKVNGIITLGDFKTGSNIYPEYFIQLSGYNQAYIEEQTGIKVEHYMILNFNKDTGDFKIKTKHVKEIEVRHFNALLNIKRFLAELQKDLK
jgi:hypothetical protein